MAEARAPLSVGTKTFDVNSVRNDDDSSRVRAKCHGTATEIAAACGDDPGAAKHRPGRVSSRCQLFGDVDIGPVQADDEGKSRHCRRGEHATGNYPVSVHDRRATRPGDVPRGSPTRGERQRGCGVRGATQADVGAHGGGVAEDIQRLERRVLVEMKRDAVLGRAPRDERMPGRHDMDLMTSRGHRLCDRLHEGPDAVARKTRIRGRHHDDDVAHLRVLVAKAAARVLSAIRREPPSTPWTVLAGARRR